MCQSCYLAYDTRISDNVHLLARIIQIPDEQYPLLALVMMFRYRDTFLKKMIEGIVFEI